MDEEMQMAKEAGEIGVDEAEGQTMDEAGGAVSQDRPKQANNPHLASPELPGEAAGRPSCMEESQSLMPIMQRNPGVSRPAAGETGRVNLSDGLRDISLDGLRAVAGSSEELFPLPPLTRPVCSPSLSPRLRQRFVRKLAVWKAVSMMVRTLNALYRGTLRG